VTDESWRRRCRQDQFGMPEALDKLAGMSEKKKKKSKTEQEETGRGKKE